MIAAINAAATSSVIAMLVLSLVGLWVITQLRIWRCIPRARPPFLHDQGGLRCLEATNVSRGAMIFPDVAST